MSVKRYIYPRELTQNYLRNGDFSDCLTFWEHYGGWLGAGCTDNCIDTYSTCFYGYSDGSLSGIRHVDYIPVQYREEIEVKCYARPSIPATGWINANFYDEYFNSLIYASQQYSLSSNQYNECYLRTTVPRKARYVRFSFNCSAGSSFVIRIANASLAIQPKESISEGYLGLTAIEEVRSTNVPANGGYEFFFLQPPKGIIYKTLIWQIYAPNVSGATSGSHEFILHHSSYDTLRYAVVTHPYNYRTGFMANIPYDKANATTVTPAPTENLVYQLSNLYATYDHYIKVRYNNNTNAVQTGARAYRVLVLVFEDYSY